MITSIILYGLAAYGGWTLAKKVYTKVKGGNIKEKLLQSETVRRLAGRSGK